MQPAASTLDPAAQRDLTVHRAESITPGQPVLLWEGKKMFKTYWAFTLLLGLTDISSFNLPSAHCIEMTVSVSHVRKMCLGNIIYITRPKIPWSLTGKPTTGSHSAALPLTQAGIVILFWGTSYLLFRKPLSL